MPAILTARDASPDPIHAIREACHWAALAGIPVGLGDGFATVMNARVFGMPTWLRRDTTRAVDPLGAILLQLQPDIADPLLAVGSALGIGQPELAGIVAGLDHEQPSALWTGSNCRDLFLAGYETGTRLRTEILTRVCDGCGGRVRHGKPCPRCTERNLGTPLPGTKLTGRTVNATDGADK